MFWAMAGEVKLGQLGATSRAAGAATAVPSNNNHMALGLARSRECGIDL